MILSLSFLTSTALPQESSNGLLEPFDLQLSRSTWGADWTVANDSIFYTDWTITQDDGLNFSWKWDIFLTDSKGEQVRNITRSNSNDFASTISPDGGRICFVSDRDGDLDLYIMNIKTGRTVNITNTTEDEFSPHWSPDGRTIAFSRRKGSRVNICAIELTTKKFHNLTNGPYECYDPNWLPNGNGLLFSSNMHGPFQIYRIDETGKNLTRLTFSTYNETVPSVSPSGETIAFNSNRDNLGPKRSDWVFPQIYLMDKSGHNVRRLIYSANGGNSQLKWSVNDDRILFSSWRGPNRNLYIARIDGSDQRAVFPETSSHFYKIALSDGVIKAIDQFNSQNSNSKNKRFFADHELRNLGFRFYESGQLLQALKTFEFYSSRNPKDELAQDCLLVVCKALGMDVPPYPDEIVRELRESPEASFELFENLIDRYPKWYLISPESILEVSRFLEQRGEPPSRKQFLEIALRKYPDNSKIRSEYANLRNKPK